jgi:hypothetical protein
MAYLDETSGKNIKTCHFGSNKEVFQYVPVVNTISEGLIRSVGRCDPTNNLVDIGSGIDATHPALAQKRINPL